MSKGSRNRSACSAYWSAAYWLGRQGNPFEKSDDIPGKERRNETDVPQRKRKLRKDSAK